MLGPAITLIALALSLAWALLLRAGVLPSDWNSTVLFVGCICLIYWFFVRRRLLAPSLGWVKWAIWAIPCYCAFQLLPLPLGLLSVISPARAQMVKALAPVVPAAITSAPLAVNPPMAVLWGFTMLSFIATFFLMRELGWRFAERPWVPLIPLMVLGLMEGAVGMAQVATSWPNGLADGTFTNRDHFSGMMEMLLPLAVMFGWAILRGDREKFDQRVRPALAVFVVWATAALLLLAIIYSLSRMGFFVALCTLFLIAALSFGPHLPSKNLQTGGLTILALGALALFIFLPPDQLLGRFAEMSASGKISADTRLSLWQETLLVINDFRWFGCGLGGFEPTFLKYQASVNGYRVEFAHNDYLQHIVEMGLVGFGILMTAVVGVLISVVRGILKGEDENRRLLLIGCAGSFLAIGLHSLVDFNLYIPANGMILAWIAGVASVNGLD